MTRLICALAAATWSTAILPARAQAHSGPEAAGDEAGAYVIAVPPFRVDGEMSDAAVKMVEEELRGGLDRAGVGVVAPDDVKAAFEALPCENAGCIVKLAHATSATHVLEVSLASSGRDYTLDLVLKSGVDGSTLTRSRQDCEICGLKELGELVADQAAALKPKLGTIPAMLIVETNPPGALVKVDGRVVGVTPVVEPVQPGRHAVLVPKDGCLSKEREITFVQGGEESVTLTLQAVPVAEGPVDVAPKKYPGIPVGWTLFGVGLGAIAAGAPLLVIDGRPQKSRCTGENIDAEGNCRFVYTTQTPGAVLVAVGGAMAIAGGVLAGLTMAKKKKNGRAGKAGGKRRAEIVPFGLGVAGRF